MPSVIESWPILTVAGVGFIAWGENRARVNRVVKDVEAKASREVVDRTVDQIDKRLERIETKLDRLVEKA